MKHLKTYIECDTGIAATPANTLGMGNPGEIGVDTLSEPIATAKSEVEKDKKKRKKKIKDLTESLFDDNIHKDLLFGDVLELEGWELEDIDLEPFLEVIMSSNFKEYKDYSFKKIHLLTKKSPWKQFLKPFELVYADPDDKKWNNERYWWNQAFWYFTWVVMCCKDSVEIKSKLTSFINSSRNSAMEVSWHRTNAPITKVEVTVLNGLGDMKDVPRMVVIKFASHPTNVMVWMKLKKKV